jgi:uncharacterized protein (DUF1778 family)
MEKETTQITFKLNKKEIEIIKRAAENVGLGHTTFSRTSTLEKARKILIENNISI